MSEYYKIIDGEEVKIRCKVFNKLLDSLIKKDNIEETTYYNLARDNFHTVYILNGKAVLKKVSDC